MPNCLYNQYFVCPQFVNFKLFRFKEINQLSYAIKMVVLTNFGRLAIASSLGELSSHACVHILFYFFILTFIFNIYRDCAPYAADYVCNEYTY